MRKGFFGAAGSPLVEDGRVIANIGGKDGAKGAGIVAFNADTGAVMWTATDDEAGYSSPVGATLAASDTPCSSPATVWSVSIPQPAPCCSRSAGAPGPLRR